MTGEVYKRAAERCFTELAQQPAMGSPLTLKRPEIAGMCPPGGCKWRVPEFESFLVLYLPRCDGISVVRVLYATRDWWSLLGMV